MTYLLHIETVTDVCSVALSERDRLIQSKSVSGKNTHSTYLTTFIEELLKKSKLKINQLNAVSVSKGPGSFTGLRIGVAVAKGLVYGLKIPLIAVNTLKALAYSAIIKSKNANVLYCPLIDARINEAYFAVYDKNLTEILPATAGIINKETFKTLLLKNKIQFFGEAVNKWTKLIIDNPNVIIEEDIGIIAENMITLAYRKFLDNKFEDIRYFEPFYLKDFKAIKFSKKISKILNSHGRI